MLELLEYRQLLAWCNVGIDIGELSEPNGSAYFQPSATCGGDFDPGLQSFPVTVVYEIDGTASAGSDHSFVSGSQTITVTPGLPGQDWYGQEDIPYTAYDDCDWEGVENLTFRIIDIQVPSFVEPPSWDPNPSAPYDVNDDEGPPVIITSGGAANERGTNGQPVNGTFTFSRTGPTNNALTFEYTTIDGTASEGADFILRDGAVTLGGAVTIPAGASSRTVTLVPIDDGIYEPGGETVILKIDLPGCNSDSSATLTITDGGTGAGSLDPEPTISIADYLNIQEIEGNVNFAVTLSHSTNQTVTVQYSTADDTAVAAHDYVAVANATITIEPEHTSGSATVHISDDPRHEYAESFFVTLSNPSNAHFGDNEAIGTILENDPLPSLSINDVTVSESAHTVTLTVTLSPVSGKTAVVNWETVPGSATADADYLTANGGLSFAPGVTTRSIVISLPTPEDILDEDDETFTVSLSQPENATISDATGVVTIEDNDAKPLVNIQDAEQGEGAFIPLEVTLSRASGRAITVHYHTLSGSPSPTMAKSGDDYFAVQSGSITFQPEDTTETIFVDLEQDSSPELDERFYVILDSVDRVRSL